MHHIPTKHSKPIFLISFNLYSACNLLNSTQFIFHAIDSSNKIVGFNEFLQRVGDNNYELIFERLKDCNITTIMVRDW